MLMKIEDVCKEFRISKASVYSWCSQGLLPALHIGHGLRFERDELIAWFKNGKFEQARHEKIDAKVNQLSGLRP